MTQTLRHLHVSIINNQQPKPMIGLIMYVCLLIITVYVS